MIAMVQKQSGDIVASLATILFVWTILKDHFPSILNNYIKKHFHKLVRFVSPYIDITFHEQGETFSQNEAFSAIKSYLSTKASSWASSFKADFIKQSKSLILSVDDHEEVTDEFRGVKVWWVLENKQKHSKTQEKRYFKLSFLRRHRKFIAGSYIDHVINEGKALALKNRQKRMYSNTPCIDWNNWKIKWNCVYFDHPATFDTLAMESKKKEEIMNDLKKFSKAKEYYTKIGKAWKRGYLLYSPPGTGKSTMIAAMANFLNYDIYDLELTIVKNNRELRSLLNYTSSKSLIVIEDIDCSLNLTGQRHSKLDSESKSSEVTLSGLLNFIDGLSLQEN
ncbi:hypothetical protein LWI29_003695 [Acer saccharum]|uniref:Uncharacterized protein n=1 Tax=Acer saccharum TaxID=4024 RepID=A0AA39SEH8_ACESA|nr:hypothetical protein LWI29_003695 [Acer saccharum]